jgi:hypothetical protein
MYFLFPPLDGGTDEKYIYFQSLWFIGKCVTCKAYADEIFPLSVSPQKCSIQKFPPQYSRNEHLEFMPAPSNGGESKLIAADAMALCHARYGADC